MSGLGGDLRSGTELELGLAARDRSIVALQGLQSRRRILLWRAVLGLLPLPEAVRSTVCRGTEWQMGRSIANPKALQRIAGRCKIMECTEKNRKRLPKHCQGIAKACQEMPPMATGPFRRTLHLHHIPYS